MYKLKASHCCSWHQPEWEVTFVSQGPHTSGGTGLGTGATLVAFASLCPSITCLTPLSHLLRHIPCASVFRVLMYGAMPVTAAASTSTLLHRGRPDSCSEEVQPSPQSGLVNGRGERDLELVRQKISHPLLHPWPLGKCDYSAWGWILLSWRQCYLHLGSSFRAVSSWPWLTIRWAETFDKG